MSAAHCLKEALQHAVEMNQIPDTLRIYISQDAIGKHLSIISHFPSIDSLRSLSTRCR